MKSRPAHCRTLLSGMAAHLPQCAVALLIPLLLPLPALAADGESSLVSGIDVAGFDPSIAPHEDFYTYVNGTWLEKTEIPGDQPDYGIFTLLRDQSQEALRKLVEEVASKSDNEPGSDDQKVGDLYRSFMNTEQLEELGLAPLESYIAAVAAVENKQQLVELMGRHQRLGVDNPVVLFVNQDARKSDQYTVYLTQSGLTLPDRDYYLKDEPQYKTLREIYVKYVTDLFTEAGIHDPAGAAQRLLEFETKIAESHWTRVENRDPLKTYNKHSVEELARLMPHFAWSTFADVTGVAAQAEVIVRQPSFMQGFDKLLEEVPLETWKEYCTLRLIDTFAPALTARFDELHFNFHQRAMRGVMEQRPRWKRGLDLLDGMIGELVGKVYVREYFKPEAKARMNELVENLRRAFAIRIEQLEWMTPATKHQALEKLEKVRTKIGYPDKWKDYTKLEIRPDDLVGNAIRAAEFEHQRMIDKLGKPIDRDEWFMNPQTINAYYNPLMNEIVFPAAILQPPFFNLQADDAVNYGAIGAVIGHELSHGFDDKGSRYDGDGNLRNWWTEEDRKAFDERGRKLVEQYSGYSPIENMKLNGELTLGENIGDLGGVNVAYTAYRLSLDDKEAPVIDGFTGDQRFFLGYAQVWRRKYRDEELHRRLLTDPHSPSRFRVIGIVSNIDAFYEAFQVQPGHAMYIAPENRVRIW